MNKLKTAFCDASLRNLSYLLPEYGNTGFRGPFSKYLGWNNLCAWFYKGIEQEKTFGIQGRIWESAVCTKKLGIANFIVSPKVNPQSECFVKFRFTESFISLWQNLLSLFLSQRKKNMWIHVHIKFCSSFVFESSQKQGQYFNVVDD